MRLRARATLGVFLALFAAAGMAADAPKEAKATPLLSKDVIGVPGKELLMLTVEYLPGGATMPHRHDAQVFVYVLQGAIVMQVDGKEPVTLKAGDTFYENPTDVHRKSANASATEPAKFLVFMVKDKGKPVTQPAS